MCCLFGFYNYSGKELKFADTLANSLAVEATARGTDATGISYVTDNTLKIYKKPKSAFLMKFSGLKNCVCVTGHTRHATQGDKDKNYNNHPFMGYCENAKFTLSHNGVLFNDTSLARQYQLPPTKITTDSYIGVRMLEFYNLLNTDTIKKTCEKLSGSFNFSIMDMYNNLWLVRGDNPLVIVHFPEYKTYVYASTETILYMALINTPFVDEIREKNFEEIEIDEGEILLFTPDGEITRSTFKQKTTYDYYYGRSSNWQSYGGWSGYYDSYADDGDNSYYSYFDKPIKVTSDTESKKATATKVTIPKAKPEIDAEQEYFDELKRMGAYIGYKPEELESLRSSGYTLDEIADLIYM